MKPTQSNLVNLRLSLHHLQQFIIVVPRVPHPLHHLMRLMSILRHLLHGFVEKYAPVGCALTQFWAGKGREHGADDLGLTLEKVDEKKKLILDVAQLEQRRRVVAVLLLGSTTICFVSSTDGASFVLDWFKPRSFVAKSLSTEDLERPGEFLRLLLVS